MDKGLAGGKSEMEQGICEMEQGICEMEQGISELETISHTCYIV